MLSELKASLPSTELRAILQRLATKAAQEAPPAVPDQPIEERLDQLTEFLTEQGYNARWEMQDGCFELHACNCPFSGVSDHHPELCAMDQAMMQQLLPTAVRQQSRVMDGASRCTYVIKLTPATAGEA
jgi:predicted ArsR family transcriptional regulator